MTNAEKNRLQKEIVDSLKSNPRGRLLLAPRSGKTKIGISLIKREKPKSILWVTPSAKLAEEDIPAEFSKWSAKKYLKCLTTSTWMSLHKVTGVFDMIILDEEQYMTENNAVNLMNGTLAGNIITMTGTASEHFHKKDMYRKLKLPVLYKISINDAVDMKLLANYSIKVVLVPMGTEKIIEAGNAKNRFKTSETAQYKYLNEVANKAIRNRSFDKTFKVLARMRSIKNSPAKALAAKTLIDKAKGRKLIFSGTIAQAEFLSDNTYHSKTDNKDLQRFMAGDVDEIAMVNAGGTGFTYKELDHLFLIQCDSDKNGLTSQKISRTLLDQKNYEATIWLLAVKGTQDEGWVSSVLRRFDQSKVEYFDYKEGELIEQTFNTEEDLSEFKKHGVDTIQMGKNKYEIDGWKTIE